MERVYILATGQMFMFQPVNLQGVMDHVHGSRLERRADTTNRPLRRVEGVMDHVHESSLEKRADTINRSLRRVVA
jgi:hypothetical protein